jgi:hypothetical protein
MDAQWMVDVAVVALETNNMACPSGPIRAMWEKSGYLVDLTLQVHGRQEETTNIQESLHNSGRL